MRHLEPSVPWDEACARSPDLEYVALSSEALASLAGRDVPHLALETGQTSILLSVSPAPQTEGLEDEVRVESAALQMRSTRISESQVNGNVLIAGIFPNKAELGIATLDAEKLAASVFDPGVRLSVDEAGKVTTKLGEEQQPAESQEK